MNSINTWDIRTYLTRPLFLFLDGTGIFLAIISILLPSEALRALFVSVGATIFTLGITLPIALYFQAKLSGEAFDILKKCGLAGIKSIFVSRQEDGEDLRKAIEEAAQRTSPDVFLLGIAFPSLLDPNESRSPDVHAKLHDNQVNLRIIVLDPDSTAADVRSQLEVGSSTIRDVKVTLDFNIVSLMESRLGKILQDSCEPEALEILNRCREEENISELSVERLRRALRVEVRTYDIHPMAFIMGFSEDLFTEQYHFGRPRDRVPPKGCIGKHVPVIQYMRGSNGYAFMKSHFEYLWREGQDVTPKLVSQAINDYFRDEGL